MELSISFSLVRKYRTRWEVIGNAKHTTEVTVVVKRFIIVPVPLALIGLHLNKLLPC